jgi:uncharacterized protein
MNEERIGDWIQTYTGKAFYPLDPRAEEIDIIDIAHSLSLLCRFNGHCKRFYSVAEHSVLVSQHVSPKNALWALLHDAAECYTADIPRPLKPYISNWKTLEGNIMKVVAEKYGLSPEEPEEVKAVDLRITVDEKYALMNPSHKEWRNMPEPLGVWIAGLSPIAAEVLFLNRFNEINSQKKG